MTHLKKVYVSGALTGIEYMEPIKFFYKDIGTLCEELGFQAYVPHLHTDPIAHSNVTPRQVFEVDKYQVSSSDLVIAYIGYPSLGVGMELAYAETKHIPIILLYEHGKKVSKFSRGIPTVIHEIKFEGYKDALIKLRKFLEDFYLANSTV